MPFLQKLLNWCNQKYNCIIIDNPYKQLFYGDWKSLCGALKYVSFMSIGKQI